MLDPLICPYCGQRAERPLVEESGMLRCDRCWRRRAFRGLPLLALTGPSGAGKSTVGPALVADLAEKLVLAEQDVLWHPELAEDEPGHPRFRRTWPRMAAMLHQSGRPVLLCGTVVPPGVRTAPRACAVLRNPPLRADRGEHRARPAAAGPSRVAAVGRAADRRDLRVQRLASRGGGHDGSARPVTGHHDRTARGDSACGDHVGACGTRRENLAYHQYVRAFSAYAEPVSVAPQT